MAATTVDELMVEEVDFIEPGELASHAKRRMDTNETRSILVVDDDARPVGLIKRNALLNLSLDELERPVSEYMTPDCPSVRQGESIGQVDESVRHDINIEQIAVVSEDGRLVGAINRHDLATGAEAAGGSTADDGEIVANRAPAREGMTVKDSDGSKVGTISEVEFKRDGGVEFFTVEHGMVFKKHKHLPGDLIKEYQDDEAHLLISSQEFDMMHDTEDQG